MKGKKQGGNVFKRHSYKKTNMRRLHLKQQKPAKHEKYQWMGALLVKIENRKVKEKQDTRHKGKGISKQKKGAQPVHRNNGKMLQDP